MATELIATGSTAANSSDVVIADGASLTVGLKGQTGPNARVIIKLKDDGGAYNNIGGAGGELTSDRPSVVLAGPGTYRLSRIAGATCGVYSA